MSRSWSAFDESHRNNGPLAYGSNITAAFLAQFAMFFWGFAVFLKRKKYKLLCYGLVAITIFGIMYTFSRGAYLAMLVGALVLGLMKDRKLLILLGVFLVTWQAVVPAPVRERINMTEDSGGHLEASAQERVDLWANAEKSFLQSPIVGSGFATFQFGQHVDDLKDTHNWYVKVLVETGVLGFVIVLCMLQQLLATGYRLFRGGKEPLYQGLGLGLFLAMCASMVANFFGDRWTYIEITGLLWVLVAAAIRAASFPEPEAAAESAKVESSAAMNPYMAYR
jgi:O-antigen ligase